MISLSVAEVYELHSKLGLIPTIDDSQILRRFCAN